MYDPVVLRARNHQKEYGEHRASSRKFMPGYQTRSWKGLVRTAMSLSVAFAAGWLAASIL